jgi:hypothetical protein
MATTGPPGCPPKVVGAALLVGEREEIRDGRRARERDRVDPARTRRRKEAPRRIRIRRQVPLVDPQLDHIGAGISQHVQLGLARVAVELEHDPSTSHGFAQDLGDDLTERLGRRTPVHRQSGGEDGARTLGATGEDARGTQCIQQLPTAAPALGCREPGADPPAGVRDEDLRRIAPERVGRRAQSASGARGTVSTSGASTTRAPVGGTSRTVRARRSAVIPTQNPVRGAARGHRRSRRNRVVHPSDGRTCDRSPRTPNLKSANSP